MLVFVRLAPSVRATLVVAVTLAVVACVKQVKVNPVPHPGEVSVRAGIPASAKFVLRRPNGTGRVSEGSLNAEWGKFEIGLFSSGLSMVDSALLEQLLRSGEAASYEQIHAQTGADIVLEVVDFGVRAREIQSSGLKHRMACESEELTLKLVDVAAGSMMGTIVVGRSACPKLDRIQYFGPSAVDWYMSDGSKVSDPDEYYGANGLRVLKLRKRAEQASEYWEQLGKRVGMLIQERQGRAPTGASASAAPSPSGGAPVARKGYIGVGVRPVPDDRAEALGLAAGEGVIVDVVQAGGAAEAAGLAKGDVILLVDGARVTASGFVTQAGELQAGKPAKFVISRGDQRKTIEVTPSAPPTM